MTNDGAPAPVDPDAPLTVGAPVLPSRARLAGYTEAALERRWLTNFGPLAEELGARLAARFGVAHVLPLASASAALQIALRLFDVRGPVVTPAFSFAATPAAIEWAGLTPAICDIDADSLTLDVAAARRLLTGADGPGALMPVHTYGNACDVDALGDLAAASGAPLIYDAAHAFDVDLGGRSLLAHGDVSVVSFHATKPFSTVEGGALITGDPGLYERARRMANFGLDGSGRRVEAGTNAKMSELHAAYGLALLDDYDALSARRRAVCTAYAERLPGDIQVPRTRRGTPNGAYFPILMPDGAARDRLMAAARADGIGLRAYFDPPLAARDGSAPAGPTPVTADVCGRIVCLPVHPDLTAGQIARVCARVEAAII